MTKRPSEREYAEGDLRLLLADRVLSPIEVRVLHANLRRTLPLLLKLWDAAKEAAGTISMSREHSCSETYGFLDKEPALRLIRSLEELRLGWSKEVARG